MKWFVYLCLFVSVNTMANGSIRAVVSWDKGSATVEVAETFEQRQKGLQNRDSLCDECGMLFVFKKERMVKFWMKNTTIPLDIAYIDSKGKIESIKKLTPLNLKTVNSDSKVKYALEMNRGWFNKKGIKAGDKIAINFVADVDKPKLQRY